MKKKNLIILLIFPFLIAVFCIVTVNTTYNKIDVDISYIDWEYNDMEAFQISDGRYLLEAVGVNQRHYKVSGDGALVWFVENKDGSSEPYAEIVEQNGKFYLRALSEGEVVITCSNKKGNVYRQMVGVIYKDAAILLYPKVGSSQNQIDSTVYYGEYDHRVGTAAVIDMTVLVVPDSAAQEVQLTQSDNVRFDAEQGKIYIQGVGAANVTLSLPSGAAAPRSFSFEIVDEGVNVYNYDDLMYCTNRSEQGQIAVLRKSFESLDNAYIVGDNGKPAKSGNGFMTRSKTVECFGTYDEKTGGFDFSKDVYTFTTTYNKNFIEQWNAFAAKNSQYSPITDQIHVGLHVQKDFYGNGFTLNLHNLTYPYAYVLMNNDSGEMVRIPQLTSANLFRGPLKFYSMGDPNNAPLMSLYGQDNIGMYVDGDGITVNDVNLKNCEFGDRMANLATVGTVLEVHGKNVKVQNSRLMNGKNVVRSYSSMDLLLENCMLSNAQNFLFLTGSNEYVPVDRSAVAEFYTLDGTTQRELVGKFMELGAEGRGDAIVNAFISEFYDPSSPEAAKMKKALTSIQEALTGLNQVKGNFKGSAKIKDCYFYQSGVASIGLETLFNSPFLENNSPSMISMIFEELNKASIKSLVPYMATKVSGTSYPVKVDIQGNTRFYDYKVADQIELGGLIEENISSTLNNLGLEGIEITLDDLFPLKSVMMEAANNQVKKSTYTDAESGKKYVNIPVAYYGGGINLSQVTWTQSEHADHMGVKANANLLNRYLAISASGGDLQKIQKMLWKTVITVTGFEPFAFHFTTDGYWYGETPKATDLIANAKEKRS